MTINTEIERENEGCSLTAYRDSIGVPTLGFGHTAGVKMGDTCTQAQAEAWLLSDLKTAINAVEAAVKKPISAAEESALVDLVFNIGQGNFQHSTLLRLLNDGNYDGACAEFQKWNRAGGVVLAGLVRRRAQEATMFKQGEV